jgi:mannose-1-phosphate guanylyltransferase
MFVWKADAILAEIKKQMPELFKVVNAISSAWDTPKRDAVIQEHWSDLKSQTIDYGIMEHAEKVAVLPAGGLGWSDVGSWDSLFEVLIPDADGNIAVNAEHIEIDSRRTLAYSANGGRLMVTIGLDDVIVVDSGDVLLVCKADQAQRVRDVVEQLKKNNREKYL